MKKHTIIAALLGLMAMQCRIKAENPQSFFQWLFGSSNIHKLEVYNDLPVEVTVTPMCWEGEGNTVRIAPDESVDIVSPCDGQHLTITDGHHTRKFSSKPGNQRVVVRGMLSVIRDGAPSAEIPLKSETSPCSNHSQSIVNQCYKEYWEACRETCFIQARADELD